MNSQQNSKTQCQTLQIQGYGIKNGQIADKQYPSLLGFCNDEIELKNLVPLSEIVPIEITDLLLYLYHLFVLELYRRGMSVESLNLQEIKVSRDKDNPFVYVRSNLQKITSNTLLHQIQKICIRLNLPMQIYRNTEVRKIGENILEQYLFLIGKKKEQLHLEKSFRNLWKTVIKTYQIPEDQFSNSQVSKAIIGIIKKPSFLTTDQEEVFIKISNKEFEVQHLKEINILEQCYQCSYLPKIYGYFRYQSILITFYKIHKVTLEQFNEKIMDDYKENKITQQQIIKIQLVIFQNLLKAIQYLHKNKIVHRDLKPLNIMLDYEDENEVYENPQKLKVIIIDFDNSIIDNNEDILESQKYVSNYMGTQLYAPPEIAESNLDYTNKVDIYQLGLIFLDMIKGCRNILKEYQKRPIKEQQFNEFISKITQHENKFNQNQNLIALFLGMISFKQKNRPSTEEVLQQFEEIIQNK